MPLPLATAQRIAEKIVAELTPFCERIEVAGSIRRQRPMVGDIDLVVLPGDYPGFRARVLQRCRLVRDGKETLIVELPASAATEKQSFQLDIWIAKPERKELFEVTPSNFGSLLLCRTGSAAHNIWLVDRAKRMDRAWNPYFGVFAGRRCIASATEEDIFKALDLAFIPPERRER